MDKEIRLRNRLDSTKGSNTHVNRLLGGEEKESVTEENLLRSNDRKLPQFVKRQRPTDSRSSVNPIQDK